MRKLILFIFTIVILGTSIRAQDKIYRKNGQIVKAKVIEIGSTDIKYKVYGEDDGPVYVLEKDRIKKIEYENGKTEKFIIDLKDPEQYIQNETNPVKRKLLSMNAKGYGSPVHISTNGLIIKHEALLQLMKEKFEAYKSMERRADI